MQTDENNNLLDEDEKGKEKMSDESEAISNTMDYKETRRFCYCFSLKCGIIFLSVVILLDFLIEVLQVVAIFENEHFDPIYPQIYVSILSLFFISVALILVFIVGPDTPGIRLLVPWAFLIAAIANFLIAIWIIIYISAIYK